MMKVYTISTSHPEFGSNPERNSLYLHEWYISPKGFKSLMDSWNLRWQGKSNGIDVYRDLDGNFKPIQEIADRLGAQINPRDC